MVSEKMQITEISDAEKRELIMKVYPRLKKRTKLLRLLRVGNALFIALFITACATTQLEQSAVVEKKPSQIGMQIRKGLVKSDVPEDFEKEMPSSDITLASIISFTKKPTVKDIADDVTDLDYENGLLVLLKGRTIETNRIDCPSILLPDDKYRSIQLENGLAVVAGSTKAVLADIAQCGTLYETNSAGKGFSLSKDYFLEITGNTFSIYDSRRTRELHKGDFLGSVYIGMLSGDKAMFVNDNGKIALMSARTGKYIAIYGGSVQVRQAYFENDSIYVYDEENDLRRLTADYKAGRLIDDGNTQAIDGCFFFKRSGKLYCDGYIYGLDIAYDLPVDADKGLIRDGLIFVVKDGVVSFVDTTLAYKKSVKLAPAGNRLCLKDGLAYFTDFNGSFKYISASGDEETADEMPDECDHSFDFEQGALRTPDGKEIYRFADIVNSSEKAYMLKRVIDDEVYYYFEKKPLSD
ncbi:hypothetical protein Dacet_0479 [Denitrovibrio acetiphilus DSM 12809]|uniref:Uncharacterized protein n=1 Tax=Denitrovibrio acetiphilus (strain DSM 12809 / NBRC 114555 / N2460) TaxID=522772 RepID=D4H3W6_DENA2|nr:hypothetical protein Dacet_0479 [Denitrovibrio acetiphilus DSM 12809]